MYFGGREKEGSEKRLREKKSCRILFLYRTVEYENMLVYMCSVTSGVCGVGRKL